MLADRFEAELRESHWRHRFAEFGEEVRKLRAGEPVRLAAHRLGDLLPAGIDRRSWVEVAADGSVRELDRTEKNAAIVARAKARYPGLKSGDPRELLGRTSW
ncbi:hypothetical protein [Geodermatophilus marinus]|uniref:hypothetical protein n=1 Tax=Geodermatophilus sp. LHW52908 TaxID=2303986 RepID=UPI0011C17423|nr:hypothetical protein [Geodermatophilus sp. LHW52908]